MVKKRKHMLEKNIIAFRAPFKTVSMKYMLHFLIRFDSLHNTLEIIMHIGMYIHSNENSVKGQFIKK